MVRTKYEETDEKKQRADVESKTGIKYKKMWQIYLLTQFKATAWIQM